MLVWRLAEIHHTAFGREAECAFVALPDPVALVEDKLERKLQAQVVGNDDGEEGTKGDHEDVVDVGVGNAVVKTWMTRDDLELVVKNGPSSSLDDFGSLCLVLPIVDSAQGGEFCPVDGAVNKVLNGLVVRNDTAVDEISQDGLLRNKVVVRGKSRLDFREQMRTSIILVLDDLRAIINGCNGIVPG